MELLRYLWDRAVSEGGVVSGAPMLFFGAVLFASAVAAFGIWAAISWSYSSRFEGQASTLSSLESRLKLKDDQLADYKSKLDGASPDEARKRLAQLELQVKALSPRRLSEEQKAAISRSLAGSKARIDIMQDAAAAEIKPLSADLASAFMAADWAVNIPVVMGINAPPPSGVGLRGLPSGSLSPAQARVKAALEAAKIEFDWMAPSRHDDKADAELVLTVRGK
jgi:hypothetical protein